MENQTLQFKTNLNCGGCVSKVQSDLDQTVGEGKWDVDIDNSDKVLTVKSNGVTESEVIAIVESKGFKAEPLAAE